MRPLVDAACLWLAAALYPAAAERPHAEIQTNLGKFVIEPYPDYAHKTVTGLLQYVNEGFYDDALFHRLVKGLHSSGRRLCSRHGAQANLPADRERGQHGIGNEHYAVAMAHDADANSATSPFFINDNYTPNFERPTLGDWGYTVFGRVVRGTELIGAMGAIPVQPGRDFIGDVPSKQIVLQKARVLPPDTT